jgi:hypothetical protein
VTLRYTRAPLWGSANFLKLGAAGSFLAVMSNAIRLALVGLLLVGGLVRLATAATPERAAVEHTASSGVCQLGKPCK